MLCDDLFRLWSARHHSSLENGNLKNTWKTQIWETYVIFRCIYIYKLCLFWGTWMIQSVDFEAPSWSPPSELGQWHLEKLFSNNSCFREGPGRISPYWINNHLLWPVFRVGGSIFSEASGPPCHTSKVVTDLLWESFRMTCDVSWIERLFFKVGWVPTMRQVRLIKAFIYIYRYMFIQIYVYSCSSTINVIYYLHLFTKIYSY